VNNPKGNDGKSKKPFLCIQEQDYQTKAITRECPQCTLMAKNEKRLKVIVAELESQGKTKEEVSSDPRIKALSNWKRENNLDRKWYMYAKSPAGEWNILLIPHSAKKKLDATIKEIATNEGVAALRHDGGVWFKFDRQGFGPNAYGVRYVQDKENINGKVVSSIRMAPLTQQDVEQLKALPKLSSLVKNLELTNTQIKQLADSGNDPDQVAGVFNTPVITKQAVADDNFYDDEASAETPPAPQKTKSAEQSEVEQLRARLAAMESQKAVPPTAAAEMGDDMSDAEFLAKFA
jgi:hypothetical protein